VNVQGLTDVKIVDVVRVLKERRNEREIRLIGLVETHEKYRRVVWEEGMHVVE